MKIIHISFLNIKHVKRVHPTSLLVDKFSSCLEIILQHLHLNKLSYTLD